MTDAGMTGPHGEVAIGVEAAAAVEQFLRQTPNRFTVATDDVRFQAIVIDADEETGRAIDREKVDEPVR